MLSLITTQQIGRTLINTADTAIRNQPENTAELHIKIQQFFFFFFNNSAWGIKPEQGFDGSAPVIEL